MITIRNDFKSFHILKIIKGVY